ncbi:MAG: S1 family peptidase [Kofleriaceae bacterium]
MPRRLLLSAGLLAISSAGAASAETHGTRPVDLGEPSAQPVIGGTAVPAGKWPDTVAVIGTQGTCTGTLIAPDVVLTAGHCEGARPIRVIANTTNYNAAGGITSTIKSFTTYPSWQTSYDVAVIVLNTPITGVAPRRVGTACSFQGFGASMTVRLVGFGLTDTAGVGDNTRLNETSAPVTDPDCTAGNGCMASVSPGGEFVAGGSGRDSCYGDSGGPVYLDTPRGTIVIGAVSRGVDDSPTPCGGGGIYVRTDKVVQWLETTTGKQIAKDTCQNASEPPADDGNSGTNNGNDRGVEDDYGDVTGGCSTGGGAGGAGAIALGLLLVRRRRGAQAQD